MSDSDNKVDFVNPPYVGGGQNHFIVSIYLQYI